MGCGVSISLLTLTEGEYFMVSYAGSAGITLFMIGTSVSNPLLALVLCLTGLSLLKL